MLAKLLSHWPLAALRRPGALWRGHGRALGQARRVPGALRLPGATGGGAASQRACSGHEVFRSARRPTELDKKLLLWTGRFKKEEDIPPFVSLQTLQKARNLVRIQICYVMIALTVLGCVAMVISGRQAAKRHDTLERRNVEKKAQWRRERETEQGLEPAAARAE